MADFSTTVYGVSDETGGSWLFGNPIREQLNASMASIAEANSGLIVQNSNFQQASGGAGILRTMNDVIKKASDVAKANSVAVSWSLAILGVLVVAKAVGGRGRR